MRIPYHWKRILTDWRRAVREKLKAFKFGVKDVELELYDINVKAKPFFRWFSILLLVLTILSLILSLGLDISRRLELINEYIEFGLLGGFAVLYLGRLILTSRRYELILARLPETVLFLLTLVIIGGYWLLSEDQMIAISNWVGLSSPYNFTLWAVKIALLFIITAKFIQITPLLLSARLHPGRVLAVSFFSLIVIGTMLLMTPVSTVDGEGLELIDALFTATSAVCVTGLIVVDTATHFTTTGQVIIMILFQLGGIGIITFATFFAFMVSSRIGMGQIAFLKDIVKQPSANQAVATVRKIVGLTLLIEAIGAGLYYLSWQQQIPDGGERFFASLFHAISAFCNAGFSIFSNSFADPANALSIPINMITILLIILGGLGFTTFWELATYLRKERGGSRRLSIHSRLVVITSLVLIVVGMIGIWFVEYGETFSGHSWGEQFLYALFQSVTTRTAGFNSVDIGALGLGSVMVIMILMAIGASPASTGGGIKTTTLAVLVLAVRSTIRGDERIEFARKTIPTDIVLKALTSLLLAGGSLLLGTTLLTITEELPFLDLLFEEISAFSTVGLSRGITSSLSDIGKVVIIISMFVGRIGSVTLFAAFAERTRKQRYKYPTESVMVS